MSRRLRRFLLRVAIILNLLVTMPLIATETLLQVIDPWGAKRYFGDLGTLFEHMQPDTARGYMMKPGEYLYSNWLAVILPDGTRLAPDTASNGCTLAFLGDSVTFGFGVSDVDTWVNQLALQFPTVHFLNTGVNGYNAAQIVAVRKSVAADGYLYLLINNDADPTLTPDMSPHATTNNYQPMIQMYLYVWQTRSPAGIGTPPDYPTFDTVLAALKADPKVSIVGFSNDPLAKRAGVPVIPAWKHGNSYTDGHPNPEGSQEIAKSLMPYIAALIQRVCD